MFGGVWADPRRPETPPSLFARSGLVADYGVFAASCRSSRPSPPRTHLLHPLEASPELFLKQSPSCL